MKRWRFVSGLLTALLALTVWVGAKEPGEIVIIHTNDIHCAYLAYDKVATLAEEAAFLIVQRKPPLRAGVQGSLKL